MFSANILQPLTNVEEWVLEHLHSAGLTWGLAIVGLTLMTRFLMLPLIVKQFRSQREMKRHMPEMKKLQEKYKGGDKQQLQVEMAAYYKEHGINPLASIGPLLLQIPIFISLYMLLRHDATNGLFGDGSFLFIPDLTEKPTGGVLVAMLAIYVCSQLASSAIATRTLQPSHRKMAMALPLAFAWVIARFPAGLAIYSITTSFWSLGQQITFWRLSAAPAGTAALAAEIEGRRDRRRRTPSSRRRWSGPSPADQMERVRDPGQPSTRRARRRSSTRAARRRSAAAAAASGAQPGSSRLSPVFGRSA